MVLLVLFVFRYDWNCKTIVMMKVIDGNVMMIVHNHDNYLSLLPSIECEYLD